jgi:hypothetical protein
MRTFAEIASASFRALAADRRREHRRDAARTPLPLRGTHLIEASAGTGKTHTITTLYLWLLSRLSSWSATSWW